LFLVKSLTVTERIISYQ